jgi:dipeptidase E
MRLYLSSYRLGNQPGRLVDLTNQDKRAAVVLNACDILPDGIRLTLLDQEVAALQSLGFAVDELDLRDYFNSAARPRDLAALSATYGLVWVRGGNSFVLRRAMKASGFDNIVRDLLERDSLVYGGFSAGAAVLTPSLRGVELVDDPLAVPQGYDPEVVWEGLGLLPYMLAPHYKSDHPESADIEKVVAYYVENHILFRALRDGETIVVDGEREEVLA